MMADVDVVVGGRGVDPTLLPVWPIGAVLA